MRKRRTPKSVQDRFHTKYKIDPVTECWNWTAALTTNGYGKLTHGSKLDGTLRTVSACRWIMEELHGPMADGYEPDHLCENKLCVNPDHLEIVTWEENQRRRHLSYTSKRKRYAYNPRRDATVEACFKGHIWVPEMTIIKKDGTRKCRICTREVQKEWARKKRLGENSS